jgi:hypothetical protein
MGWIEDLMKRLCKERGIPCDQASNGLPKGATSNPLLRQDLWGNLFYGNDDRSINSRFMKPMCSSFSINIEDEESDSRGEIKRSMGNLVLYIPFMHWESHDAWEERQELLRDIKARHPTTSQADGDLLEEYLLHKSRLHDRRSLSQFYYYNHTETKSLSNGQVIQRHTSPKKMIVVDQLWLWVIRGSRTNTDDGVVAEPDLVVTAFPERFDGRPDPTANVYQGIVAHLKQGLDPPLKSTNDLVSVIIEHCTGVFFQRQLDKGLWFLEFFANEIASVVRLISHYIGAELTIYPEKCRLRRILQDIHRTSMSECFMQRNVPEAGRAVLYHCRNQVDNKNKIYN